MKPLIEIIGISILVSFTVVVLAVAAHSGGALIYYWETSVYVFFTELLLGVVAVIIGCKRVVECLGEMGIFKVMRGSGTLKRL